MTCTQVGMLRTAAALFQDLGLFKEMVECYIAMDEEQEAEKIVTEQVRNHATQHTHTHTFATHIHMQHTHTHTFATYIHMQHTHTHMQHTHICNTHTHMQHTHTHMQNTHTYATHTYIHTHVDSVHVRNNAPNSHSRTHTNDTK